MDQHDALIREIRSFLKRSGMAPTTFGRAAVNDGKFLSRLEGGGNITIRTAERVMEFIRRQEAA